MFDWFRNLFKSKHRKQVQKPRGYSIQIQSGNVADPEKIQAAVKQAMADAERNRQAAGRKIRPVHVSKSGLSDYDKAMISKAAVHGKRKPTPAPTRNTPGYNPTGDSFNAFYTTGLFNSYDSGSSSSSSSCDFGSSSSGSDSGSSGGGSDC